MALKRGQLHRSQMPGMGFAPTLLRTALLLRRRARGRASESSSCGRCPGRGGGAGRAVVIGEAVEERGHGWAEEEEVQDCYCYRKC